MASGSASAAARPGKTKLKISPADVYHLKSISCDALMEETEKAIAGEEYARASLHLKSLSDAEEADRAYRSACAAIARGDLDMGMEFLRTALQKCPPNKPNAISKIKLLISHTKQQQHKPHPN